jgi:transcriptional regulator with PAS, ATPase and Fis domain
MVKRVATTDVAVLIQGESGTGKEVIAQILHEASRRTNSRMVSINCGAIQENLLLSELFGHEKGAFTGAMNQKRGLVEIADGGTLFLDEIGEMGLEAQAKLLRFLQEGEIYRVGGKDPIRVNVRIVSATNKDLETQVRHGKFREDLYYRINTLTVHLPPLRNRTEDISLLVEYFLKSGLQTHVQTVSADAMQILSRYGWPGNVRELQNTVERFKVLVETPEVCATDIPANIRGAQRDIEELEGPDALLLANIERRHIFRVLEHFKGNKTKASNAMGITVKTLYNKLALYAREGRTFPSYVKYEIANRQQH